MSNSVKNIEFIQVDLNKHRETFSELNVEYLTWINEKVKQLYDHDITEAIQQSIPEYIKESLDHLIDPPKTIFYIVYFDGEIAGMGGLKTINQELGEIKRMFVRPEFRGQGIGKAIIDKLISKAQENNFKTLRLDSAGFMSSAHKLYKAAGFYPIEMYPGSEGITLKEIGVDIIFMEKIM
ncbi:MAG: GNAT family N-acetyltransferase [Candidatus Kariarchaeaceae archaeon]|jgi:GNAT superfamily N-acetyltransferase